MSEYNDEFADVLLTDDFFTADSCFVCFSPAQDDSELCAICEIEQTNEGYALELAGENWNAQFDGW